MNRRQVILTVVAVGLVSAALWAWHQGSNNPDATPAHAAAPTPANPFSPSSSARVAASDAAPPAPAAPPQTQAAPAAPDVSQSTVSAPVAPPNVDTPEPAEQKFARGAHRQSEQN
jgi:hypothetical protein